MLENNLPLKIASWDTEDLYRTSLSLCSIDNYDSLVSYLDSLNDFKEDYRAFY